MSEKVTLIDLDEIASVQACLPACSACGGRRAKHACFWSEAEGEWMHSWYCIDCDNKIGPHKMLTYYIASAIFNWSSGDLTRRYSGPSQISAEPADADMSRPCPPAESILGWSGGEPEPACWNG